MAEYQTDNASGREKTGDHFCQLSGCAREKREFCPFVVCLWEKGTNLSSLSSGSDSREKDFWSNDCLLSFLPEMKKPAKGRFGAVIQDRTGDLRLTMATLYQLSYDGKK